MKLRAGEMIGLALGLTCAPAGAGMAAPVLYHPQNLKQVVVKSIGF